MSDSGLSDEEQIHNHVHPIDFLIVGGGAVGLSCAITLRRSGHRVTLLEQKDSFDETTGSLGIVVPPNMSKLLVRWGLEKELREWSITTRRFQVARYESGVMIGQHEWVKEIFDAAGGDFMIVPYSPLRKQLKDLATRLGVTLRTNAQVVSVVPSQDHRPYVLLASGEKIETDVIIGADGMGSLARTAIVGQEERPSYRGFVQYTLHIPAASMMEDPEFASLIEVPVTVHTWFGNGTGGWGYLVKSRPDDSAESMTYALILYLPVDDPPSGAYFQPVDPQTIHTKVGECEPRLKKLLKLATKASVSTVNHWPELENWVHDNGALAVVGDAAHSFYPGAMQVTSMGMGDAAVLGHLFLHFHHRDQIMPFLRAYQEIRSERVKRVLASDENDLRSIMLPNAPEQEVRDKIMKEHYEAGESLFSSPDGGPNDLIGTWESTHEIFAYDAEDEADDWWVQWGSLQERARFHNIDAELAVSVETVEELIVE